MAFWRSAAAILAVMAASNSAHAFNVNEADWLNLSDGATTCGEFIAQPGMQAARTEWVLGYISGRNREASSPRDRFVGSSFQQPTTVIGWLTSYSNFMV
jgi:hypothetical protein